MDWATQNVCVIGLGQSGVAAANLLLEQGASVTALDTADTPALAKVADELIANGARCILGANEISDQFTLVVISPGIPLDSPLLSNHQARQMPVWGELELAWHFLECPVIAITGTNGKTTTTELVASLITQANRSTITAGNIGNPLCNTTAHSSALDALLVEVSSFQLESIKEFHPSIGVLLNLSPDHLDRHGSMENYIRAKARLFETQNPNDHAIIQHEALHEMQKLGLGPASKITTFSLSDSTADYYLEGDRIHCPDGDGLLLDDRLLNGSHHLENLIAATVLGHCIGISSEKILAALKATQPPAHRCEFVAKIDGVQFVNDSKATNVHALCSALRGMPWGGEKKNIWLIAGGQGKGADFSEATPEIARRVKGAFLLGEAQAQIHEVWAQFCPCEIRCDLIETVAEARRKAVPGDVVLLSPACASFDQFDSYEHRGCVFTQAVLAEESRTRTDD